MSKNSSVRVRFAPSPTGHLHIGGLRTALFNWLFARHYKGTFLIRIEDTDTERSTDQYVQSIISSLAWAQLESDEPIVIQSDRIVVHQKIINDLVQCGKAYKCFCVKDDLINRYESEHEADFFVKYDGYCRDRLLKDTFQDKPYVVRFALPQHEEIISFDDIIRGTVSFSLDQLDDFIIARSDGRPIYNFVVVVDDAFMNISHVIRGEDHISNTPKQILLYKACGYSVPQFAHLPLILGSSGNRLSKREAATSVLEYKDAGFLPDALLNYLVRLGWSHGDQEVFTLSQLVEFFSLEHVGKKGSIFDIEKLQWLNAVYIRTMTPQALLTYARTIQSNELEKINQCNAVDIESIILLYQERIATVGELVEELVTVCNGPQEYNADDVAKWIDAETRDRLIMLIALFEQVPVFEQQGLKNIVKECADKLSIKLVVLAQPIRIALIGKSSGPGVFDLLISIKKEKAISRLQKLVDYIKTL